MTDTDHDAEAIRGALEVHCQDCGAAQGVGCWVEAPDLSRPPHRVDRTPLGRPHLSRVALGMEIRAFAKRNRKGP